MPTSSRLRWSTPPGWRAFLPALSLIVIPALAPAPVQGQTARTEGGANAPGMTRPTSITPTHGPIGTPVTLRGEHLPAITPVQLAIGGTRSGFEALEFALTTPEGKLEEVLEIPQWARPDRAHRFIIFDVYFGPLATSPLFHVTDEEGRVVREGELIEALPGCTVLLATDRERYLLTGPLRRDPPGEGGETVWTVGERMQVEGRIGDTSPCAAEGIPLEIVRTGPAQGG